MEFRSPPPIPKLLNYNGLLPRLTAIGRLTTIFRIESLALNYHLVRGYESAAVAQLAKVHDSYARYSS
jgi:hypothetical protein